MKVHNPSAREPISQGGNHVNEIQLTVEGELSSALHLGYRMETPGFSKRY